MKSILPASLLTLAVALSFRAAVAQEGGRQWYDKTWQWSKNGVYMYTTYHFRSKAGGDENTHRVVWYPNSQTNRNFVYYFNRDKELIWCRAKAFDRRRLNLWQVLDDPEKQDTIGGIASGVWDAHEFIRPPIPGSDDSVLMEPPPIPPHATDPIADP